MRQITVLFVDNDPDFLRTRTEALRQANYRVLTVSSAAEARQVLERGGIDVAVIDVRLRDDDDDKDFTGLMLAKDTDHSVPKIILTSFPTFEAALDSLKPEMDGLPAAVEFVTKQDGPEALIEAVRHAAGPDMQWLRRVKDAVAGVSAELKGDYEDALYQVKSNFRLSLIAAFLGIMIIYSGAVLTLVDKGQASGQVALLTSLSGLVTEAVGYLFFRRVDVANERMDRYHRERVEIRRFEILLQSCDGLSSEQLQDRCRNRLIGTASANWLGAQVAGQSGKQSTAARETTEA